MLTITRRLEFDTGHRLQNHESKCRNVHGHRYVALVTVSAEALDEVGRIIDFGQVKEIVGGWLDEYWDHGFIYEDGDKVGESIAKDQSMKVFVLDAGKPPTAENMVQILFEVSTALLESYGIKVEKIRLYETPNCYADYSPEN